MFLLAALAVVATVVVVFIVVVEAAVLLAADCWLPRAPACDDWPSRFWSAALAALVTVFVDETVVVLAAASPPAEAFEVDAAVAVSAEPELAVEVELTWVAVEVAVDQ